MKRLVILVFILSFLTPSGARAEEVNAGFVQGIWYATSPVFADKTNRIYVALRNTSDKDLTATVRFTDNDTRIGTTEVSALGGRLVEAWADWTPTEGEHTIVATISDAQFHIIGGSTTPIDVASVIAEDTLTVDRDSDDDGVGNTTDADDDNDTISDVDEIARGSNPLVANPPQTTPAPDATSSPSSAHTSNSSNSSESPKSNAEGLEKYVGDGFPNALLSSVTNRVQDAKQSLDTYRTERNSEIDTKNQATDKEGELNTATMTPLGTYTTSGKETRTKIASEKNFLSTFVTAVATLIEKIWTFVLFVTSSALAYPALIELLLLIVILYTIYRLMRRVGRRPID